MKGKTGNVGLILALTALLMLPLTPRAARAQMMEHHGGGMGHGGMMEGMPLFLQAADLTPAQRAQIKKILEDSHATAHSQYEQMHAAREQMADKLFSNGPLTANDLAAQTDQISKAQQALLRNELNVALQVRAVLTPAQLQKVAQVHQKFESLHQQMRALLGPPPSDGPPPGDAPPPPPPPA